MKLCIKNLKTIVTLLLFTFSFTCFQTVMASSEYGTVSINNSEYTISVNHTSLKNEHITLLIYNSDKDASDVNPSDIGYINEGVSDDKGQLVFNDIYISVPGTYNVYIGAQTLSQRELLDSIVVTKKLLGDLNGDEKYTAIDALLLLKHLDTVDSKIGDVNSDGVVDVKDVLVILRMASEKIKDFSDLP